MGLYNRPYMKAKDGPRSPLSLVTVLLWLQIGVYLVQCVLDRFVGWTAYYEWVALSLPGLGAGMVQGFITHPFFHYTDSAIPWQLLMNCLMLHFSGRLVEQQFGKGRLLELLILTSLVGAAFWALLHLVVPGYFLVGMTAAIWALIGFLCRERQHEGFSFFLIPIQFSGRRFFWVCFAFNAFLMVFGELAPNGPRVPDASASFAGLVAGWGYHQFLLRRPTLGEWVRRRLQPQVSVSVPRAERRRATVAVGGGGKFSLNLGGRQELRREVDRILDKINAEGFGALTAEEKRVLDKAKDSLR